MAIVRELVTKLGFDIDEKKIKDFDDSVKKARNGLLAMTGVVTGVSAAVVGLATNVANAGNEIAKAAVEAGMSTEKYQELRFAMQRLSRATEGEIDRAFGQLTLSIGKARSEGGRYAEALEQIGFSQRDIASGAVTSEKAMEKLAAALRGSASDADAAVLAGQLFGDRIGRRLGPAIRSSTESVEELQQRFRDLGGAMSQEGTEKSAQLIDAMLDLRTVLTGIKFAVGEMIIPVVSDMVKEFTTFIEVNREVIKQNIGAFFKGLAGFLQVVFRIGMTVGGMFMQLANHLGGVETATKLVLFGLMALFGAKTLAGIAGMVKAISGFSAVMMLAAAKPALIIAAVVAMGVAIAAVIKDLKKFFSGEDSVTGWIIDAFKTAFDWVFGAWIELHKKIFDGIKNIGSNVLGSVRNLFSTGSTEGRTAENTTGASTVNNATNNSNQQVSVNAPINVSVPPGTSPQNVGERVQRGVSEGINGLLRRAGRVTAPGLNY